MAANFSMTLKRHNGVDIDVLYPLTTWSQILNKPSTFTPTAHTHTISDVTSLQTTLDGKASTSHTHGSLTSSGQITNETTLGTGDTLVFADSSNSNALIRSSISINTTNTTQYLRADGTWSTPPTASITSVNGFSSGAINTVQNTLTTSTVNSLVYGVLQGESVVRTLAGTRLKIDTGFYNPSGSSSGNTITFNVAFSQRPAVYAFPVRAASTTATLVAAKATAVSTTGVTFISSYIASSSATYTPSTSNETYCWVAIGY